MSTDCEGGGEEEKEGGRAAADLNPVHGAHAKYNDIQRYDHQQLLPFLAGASPGIAFESLCVSTQGELQKLLCDQAFAKPDKIRLIEVIMPRDDAPQSLIKQAELTAKANAE